MCTWGGGEEAGGGEGGGERGGAGGGGGGGRGGEGGGEEGGGEGGRRGGGGGGEEGRSLIVESVSAHIPTHDKARGCDVCSYYGPDSGKGNKHRPLQSAGNKVSALCSPGPPLLCLGKDALLTPFLLPVFSL